MAHGELFAPLGVELAALSLPFGRLEGWGMRREEVFESREVPSGWEGDGGMRLAGLVARRLASALFDNRWSKPESGRGMLSGSHLRSRRPRFGPLAPGTGARAAVPRFS